MFRRLRYFLVLFFFCLTFLEVNAQIASDSTWKRSDFIANTNDYFSIKLDAHNEADRLELSTDRDYSLRPNTDIRNKLSFNYKWLTLGLSFKIENLYGNNDNTKGETETSGFNFALNFDRWTANFDHTAHTGYYVENSIEIDPSLPPGEIILLPDFKSRSTRLSLAYLTNTKFSLKSLTSLTERQLKSSGSFLPFIRMNLFATEHGEDNVAGVASTSNFQTNVGLMYTHKFVVMRNYYVAGSASFGYGNLWYQTNNQDLNTSLSGTTGMYSYHYGVTMGYNADRFFVGALFNHVGNNYNQKQELDFSTTRNSFQIFIGYRFRVPKFLRKPLDFVDETKSKIIN